MISIIIPTYNNHEWTRECVEAVRENTQDYEIVIVDNGSTPPIEGAAVRFEANLGFPIAVNHGIRVSKGDVICLLNNDVIVTPGWANRLLAALEKYDIAGPMCNYVAGKQVTSTPIYYDKQGLYERARAFNEQRKGMELEVNWIIGFCFMFRKSLYDAIGGFDESLWPCSGEEIDFCLRARSKGYRVGIVQDIYMHHEGSVTFRELDEDYNAIVERNDKHLASKWGDDFWQKQLLPLTNGKGVRLNVGCGAFKMDGFINIDKSNYYQPDLEADALDLPYDPGTVDEIYAGHLLEHLPFTDGLKALHYWHSLLKEGGLMSVVTPDITYLMKQYLKAPSPTALRDLNDTYIYSEGQHSPHRYAYDEASLRDIMEEVGFINLERMPVHHPYYTHKVVWQTGIQGRKGASNEGI